MIVVRPGADRVIARGGERAVPVAEQDGDGSRAQVGDGQVHVAIPVEVAGDQGGRVDTYAELGRGGERPIPVALQNRNEFRRSWSRPGRRCRCW